MIPTVGRSSLGRLLDALSVGVLATGTRAITVVVVDDRRAVSPALTGLDRPGLDVRVVTSHGRGPAAARNAGRRAVAAPWVVFLDDDVVPGPRWWRDLMHDLAAADPDVAAVQADLHVPLPHHRAATDWERQTAALERGYGITADLAVRTEALDSVLGFDERFRRAFREDADLVLRLRAAGWRITRGRRTTLHPVRPAPWWVSLARQAGNSDDVLMDRLHARGWRQEARAGGGRLRRHAAVAGLTAAGLALLPSRPRGGAVALLAAGTVVGSFAAERIVPGPRTPHEVAAMAATSAAIPYAAVAHHLAGRFRWRRVRPWAEVAESVAGHPAVPATAPARAAAPAAPAVPPVLIEEMAR